MSSDKLSALPSDFQGGLSATSLRMKNSALGGSGHPSISETCLASPLALHSAILIHQSLSESAFHLIVTGDCPLT